MTLGGMAGGGPDRPTCRQLISLRAILHIDAASPVANVTVPVCNSFVQMIKNGFAPLPGDMQALLHWGHGVGQTAIGRVGRFG